jgi:integrase
MTKTPKNERTAARRMAFTDLGLARLKHPDTGQVVWWDAKQVGLSVLISGSVKTFRATFQHNGRYVTSKIGRYGEMTLGDARATTAAYRVAASKGDDPRRPKASADTYGEVADRFVQLYAKPRQRTWDQTERILKRNCAPWLKKPIASITKSDAYDLLDGFKADGHDYKAGITLRWLRTMWKWAWKREHVASPLMDQVDIHFEKRERDRVYSDAEVKSIWSAADRLDPVKAAYFKLLLLLAPRKSALVAMHWSDIKNGVWVTPFEFTKSKKSSAKKRTYLTPLPALALRALSGLPKSDERVFAGLPMHLSPRFSNALRKHGAPADFSYHACRHTITTWLENNGASEWERGLILNHAGSSVTTRYSHGDPLELKMELLTRWANHVTGLVRPEGVTLLR